MQNDAYEIHGDPEAQGPLVITCEHASARVPAPLTVADGDRPWLETHWAVDIGAAALTRELADQTGSVAVLTRYSRLVCDANRAVDNPTWIRPEIEGYRPTFNRNVDASERERRRRLYYAPYHAAIDDVIRRRIEAGGDTPLLFAVHSFTRVYEGNERHIEAGVLFSHYEQHAQRLAASLRALGLRTALNEPYSGLDGLMYSVDLHGDTHGLVRLEIEIRQDTIATSEAARALARRIAPPLTELARSL